MQESEHYFNNEARYLPDLLDGGIWGIGVLDAGRTLVRPDEAYPPSPHDHPSTYRFSWEAGRVLQEYQIVHISRGRGILDSESCGALQVAPGSTFVLFPGEWHRYRPCRSTGWTDHWIGFHGRYAEALMHHFFTKKAPVINTAPPHLPTDLFQEAIRTLKEQRPGFGGILASITLQLIAQVNCQQLANKSDQPDDPIEEAKLHLLAYSNEDIDFTRLAKSYDMSYSAFRQHFKAKTGHAPHQYLLRIRCNRAKALLAESHRSIKDIATDLGFTNATYFCRFFRKETGVSPSSFRATQCRRQPASRKPPP